MREELKRLIKRVGIEKYIGRYSLKKSDIKYMGTSIQIKCIVASAFFPEYQHGIYKIDFKNNDARNCSFKNLDIKLLKKHEIHEVSQEIINLFLDYLENENLNKMCYHVIYKSNIKFTPFYNYDDIQQELICYLYNKLYEYEERIKDFRNFDQFIFYKLYDGMRGIFKRKLRNADFFTFYNLDTMINNYDHQDKNSLMKDLIY